MSKVGIRRGVTTPFFLQVPPQVGASVFRQESLAPARALESSQVLARESSLRLERHANGRARGTILFPAAPRLAAVARA